MWKYTAPFTGTAKDNTSIELPQYGIIKAVVEDSATKLIKAIAEHIPREDIFFWTIFTAMRFFATQNKHKLMETLSVYFPEVLTKMYDGKILLSTAILDRTCSAETLIFLFNLNKDQALQADDAGMLPLHHLTLKRPYSLQDYTSLLKTLLSYEPEKQVLYPNIADQRIPLHLFVDSSYTLRQEDMAIFLEHAPQAQLEATDKKEMQALEIANRRSQFMAVIYFKNFQDTLSRERPVARP